MFVLINFLLFLVVCGSATIATKKSSSTFTKNVLIFIGDDAGFETQFYNNSVCRTPNLNYLSKRSLIFDHAFTSVSSCSPSRSAILTGEIWYYVPTYGKTLWSFPLLSSASTHWSSFRSAHSEISARKSELVHSNFEAQLMETSTYNSFNCFKIMVDSKSGHKTFSLHYLQDIASLFQCLKRKWAFDKTVARKERGKISVVLWPWL